MIKKLLFVGMIAILASCKGGKKAPEMATMPEKVNLEQDASNHVAKVNSTKLDIIIEPKEGVLSIAELLENREDLNGKSVTVQGEVTKFNPDIMDRSWVHIQDGTEHNGEFDITITTDSKVAVGSLVVFTGTLALDQDFGYGYEYSTIIENAELKK